MLVENANGCYVLTEIHVLVKLFCLNMAVHHFRTKCIYCEQTSSLGMTLTIEVPAKIVAEAFCCFHFCKKMRLEVSFRQKIHMKCQALFSLKNNKNQNVVCWSCDWLLSIKLRMNMYNLTSQNTEHNMQKKTPRTSFTMTHLLPPFLVFVCLYEIY